MSFVLGITGSPSRQSRSAAVTRYALATLASNGYETREVGVSDFEAADVLHANFDSVAVKGFVELVERADAVIVSTPVYKAAYTGALKALLDLLPQAGLAGKVVWPIATGGTIAHLLCIDYALNPVLFALGARNVIGGVYLVDQQVTRQPDGAYAFATEANERIHRGLNDFHLEISRQSFPREPLSLAISSFHEAKSESAAAALK